MKDLINHSGQNNGTKRYHEGKCPPGEGKQTQAGIKKSITLGDYSGASPRWLWGEKPRLTLSIFPFSQNQILGRTAICIRISRRQEPPDHFTVTIVRFSKSGAKIYNAFLSSSSMGVQNCGTASAPMER